LSSISIIEREHIEEMQLSAEPLDFDESEVDRFNIEVERVIEKFPPIPKGVKVALFGEYIDEVNLKGSSTIPVILEIKYLYIDDKIINDIDRFDIELNALARVGGGYGEIRILD